MRFFTQCLAVVFAVFRRLFPEQHRGTLRFSTAGHCVKLVLLLLLNGPATAQDNLLPKPVKINIMAASYDYRELFATKCRDRTA